jgi:hypothetical protein
MDLLGGKRRRDSAIAAILAARCGPTIVIGYLTSAFLGRLDLLRRSPLSTTWVLILTSAHWPLLSLAAWRAVCRLVVAPYRWEKTEHGPAKSSRLAVNMTRSLLEFERYLSHLKETGNLSTLSDDVRDTAAARRPLPRVAA